MVSDSSELLPSKRHSDSDCSLNFLTPPAQVMTEILFGIRVIKFYSWEPYFTQKVAGCRRQELSRLKAIKYLDAVCVYTWAALPVVISILTFVTYVLLGHELTAAKVGKECGVLYLIFI